MLFHGELCCIRCQIKAINIIYLVLIHWMQCHVLLGRHTTFWGVPPIGGSKFLKAGGNRSGKVLKVLFFFRYFDIKAFKNANEYKKWGKIKKLSKNLVWFYF